MSIKLIPLPHEAHNLKSISIWTNSQKLRKPNPIVSARSNTYWDLRGRYQNEYDERLDLLPDEGVADTLGGELFRAATKLYYDFHNNAMVNNSSGAIKFLANNGVIPPPKQHYYVPEHFTNINKVDLYTVIYPYTTGHMIYYDQRNLYYAIQSIMDYTLEFLNKNPKLDLTPNTFDFNDMRDPEHVKSTVRCDHRNNWVHNKNAEATRQWQAKENKANTKAHSIKKKVGRKISPMRQKKKNKNTSSGGGGGGTQHPPQDRFVSSSGGGGDGGSKKKKQSNNRNNNKEKNGKKKGPRDSTNDMKHNKQHGGEGGKAKNKKNKSNDITSRLGKLGI